MLAPAGARQLVVEHHPHQLALPRVRAPVANADDLGVAGRDGEAVALACFFLAVLDGRVFFIKKYLGIVTQVVFSQRALLADDGEGGPGELASVAATSIILVFLQYTLNDFDIIPTRFRLLVLPADLDGHRGPPGQRRHLGEGVAARLGLQSGNSVHGCRADKMKQEPFFDAFVYLAAVIVFVRYHSFTLSLYDPAGGAAAVAVAVVLILVDSTVVVVVPVLIVTVAVVLILVGSTVIVVAVPVLLITVAVVIDATVTVAAVADLSSCIPLALAIG